MNSHLQSVSRRETLPRFAESTGDVPPMPKEVQVPPPILDVLAAKLLNTTSSCD